MKCSSIDSRICDYLDGTIAYEERQQFDDHITGCPSCAGKLVDAELALEWTQASPRVEPPEELVSEILKTVGPAHAPGVLLPAGAAAGSRGYGGRAYGGLRLLMQPLFEPRFAMSMALALVSFSILTLSAQRTFEQWSAEGVNPLTQVSQASREVDRLWSQGWSQGAAFVRESLSRAAAPAQEATGQREADLQQGLDAQQKAGGQNEQTGERAPGSGAGR